MDNDKNREFDEPAAKEADYGNESSTRARNRTVMLTPEITGQVRARLAQEMDPGGDDFQPFNNMARGEAAARPNAGTFIPQGNQSEQVGSTYSPQKSGGAEAPAAGARKQLPPPVSQQAAPGAVWSKETPIVGFLVSFDGNQNGDVFELRSGRLIVSCEPASGGSYLVIEDPSVSPMHAILRISTTGEVQVLDQLSEFGTHIKRFGVEEEEHISGEKSTIEHGDVIKFGNRVFHVCILALNN